MERDEHHTTAITREVVKETGRAMRLRGGSDPAMLYLRKSGLEKFSFPKRDVQFQNVRTQAY